MLVMMLRIHDGRVSDGCNKLVPELLKMDWALIKIFVKIKNGIAKRKLLVEINSAGSCYKTETAASY